MSFVLDRNDIKELLGDARHRALRSEEPQLVELFEAPVVIRTILGQLIHVAVNSHYDPGAIATYREVTDEFLEPLEGETQVICGHILHEMYLGLRSTIDPWIDQGWLHDVEALTDSETTYSDKLVGFMITPIIAPRITTQYADMVAVTPLLDHMNSKTY